MIYVTIASRNDSTTAGNMNNREIKKGLERVCGYMLWHRISRGRNFSAFPTLSLSLSPPTNLKFYSTSCCRRI